MTLILGGSSQPVWAADKTDVVRLQNGDRFTGEIVSLSRGRITLKTDNAGTIDIEWDNVASVESRRQFTVTLSDGTRWIGTLGRAADPQTIALSTDAGDEHLSMVYVTGIQPLGQSFWAKLNGSVGAGFNYTRSSQVSQLNLSSTTTYRQPAFIATLSGAATLTGQDDDDEDDTGAVANAQFMYERYRGRRLFVGGAAQAETNESLGLTLRSQVAATIGARLVNTNRAQLQIGAGISGNQERGVDVDTTNNIEGLAVFKASYYTYDRPKTNLDILLQYYPGLSNWGRQRVQLNTSVKRELWKDFSIAGTMFESFDSAPPNPSASRNDVGVSLSISWSFGS